MKIKIIDLLNKIAEGKELPEKFMYNAHLYYRKKMKGIWYRCDELGEIFEDCIVLEDLNDTIEIIEEPKKIEKLIEPIKLGYIHENLISINKVAKKVNELIDEINNLKEKKDD